MKRSARIVLSVVVISAVGIASGEHLVRRTVGQQMHMVLEHHHRLIAQMDTTLMRHQELMRTMALAQQRAHALSSTVTALEGQLAQQQGQLKVVTEDRRALQMRVAQMQHHLEQLQGELAYTLQDRQSKRPSIARAVQIEGIVVSPAQAFPLQARILSVDRKWDFIVIDVGWDVVGMGDTISIVRGDAVLAQARIDRVQEHLAAATILPGWASDAIRPNDVVRL